MFRVLPNDPLITALLCLSELVCSNKKESRSVFMSTSDNSLQCMEEGRIAGLPSSSEMEKGSLGSPRSLCTDSSGLTFANQFHSSSNLLNGKRRPNSFYFPLSLLPSGWWRQVYPQKHVVHLSYIRSLLLECLADVLPNSCETQHSLTTREAGTCLEETERSIVPPKSPEIRAAIRNDH